MPKKPITPTEHIALMNKLLQADPESSHIRVFPVPNAVRPNGYNNEPDDLVAKTFLAKVHAEIERDYYLVDDH